MKNRLKLPAAFILMILLLGFISNPGLWAQNHQKPFTNYRYQYNILANNAKNSNASLSKLDSKVTIKNGTYRLGNLINLIASQVGLRPSYSKQFVPVDKKIKMPKLKVTAKKALDKALIGTFLGFKVKSGDQLVFIKKPTNTFKKVQETVTGTVTNAQTKKSLVGVNILVKGTNTGTTTDSKGHYSVSVSSLQDTLVYSYIGFTKKVVPINGRSTINVQLNPATESLNQMVVVGYGQQKRADLTSSIATVDVDKTLNARPVANVGDALQGQVAGLTITHSSGRIGESPDITLRGVMGSVNGNGAKPLILLDGVEIQDLNSVDPHNIKSISVLKDAASTAIYGNRAAYGVILIKTKEGKKNTQPRVSYHGNYGFKTPTVTPEVAPAPEGARMALQVLKRSDPSKTEYGIIGMTISEESIKKTEEWIKKYGNQDLGREMKKGRDFDTKDGKLYFYRPWNGAAMLLKKRQPINKQNISVAGGNERTSYRLGLGYLNQVGIMKTSKNSWKRYNVNLALNSSVNSWLDVKGKFKYSLRKKVYPYTNHTTAADDWYYAYRWPAVYPYGTYQGKEFRNSVGAIKQAGENKNDKTDARASVTATAQLLPGLNLEGNATYARQYHIFHETGLPISGWDNWSGAPLTYATFTSDDFHQVAYSTYYTKRLNARAQLHYKKDIGKHSVSALVGAQPEWHEFTEINNAKTGLLGDRGELPLATGKEYASGDHAHYTTVGFYGRINYSFEDKYLLQINGRYTGSSFFPENQRYGFFPSASAGWVLSKESFMDAAKPVLSFLKIRGSYGTVGHTGVYFNSLGQNVNGYRYTQTLSSSRSGWLLSGQDQSEITFSTPQPISPSLTWEDVTTGDVGVDAKFLDNRLTAKFDWYNRLTSNMITSGKTLPQTFGANVPDRNYGKLRTRGWELELDWNQAITENFNLRVKGTLSDFHEKITQFANESHPLPYSNVQSGVRAYWKGENPNNIWGYETDRFFRKSDFKQDSKGNLETDDDGNYILKEGSADQSYFEYGSFRYGPGDVKYKDLNGDGKIAPCDYLKQKDGSTKTKCNTLEHPGDKTIIGNSAPHLQYGFTLSGNWKNIDFRFFFQGVGSRQVWASGPVFTPGNDPQSGWLKYQLDYWSPEGSDYGGGPNAFYPRLAANYNNTRNFLPQSRYLLDMGYLRLKTLTIGYSLPKSLLSAIHIQNLRIYFSGENLLTFDHMRIPVDPETEYKPGSLNNSFGREYPYHKTYSIGIDLKL